MKVQSQYNDQMRKLMDDETLTEIEKQEMAGKMEKDLYEMQQ